MKVYTCPKEVEFIHPDYSTYDTKKELAREEAHMAKLAAWLKKHGYTGKYTGEIYGEGVADGRAQYMVADGPKSCLIHLPYVDAYHIRDIEFVPKKEIIRRIEADKKLRKLFEKERETVKS